MDLPHFIGLLDEVAGAYEVEGDVTPQEAIEPIDIAVNGREVACCRLEIDFRVGG